MKPPDFLAKDFVLHAPAWCEKEGRINRHELVIVEHLNGFVSYWKTCLDCQIAHAKLSALGVSMEHPKRADRMPVTEWVFLVLHPEDVIA